MRSGGVGRLLSAALREGPTASAAYHASYSSPADVKLLTFCVFSHHASANLPDKADTRSSVRPIGLINGRQTQRAPQKRGTGTAAPRRMEKLGWD